MKSQKIYYEDKLTKREVEIFEHLLGEKTLEHIAKELFVELSTIQTHCSHIYQKLQVANRLELMAKEIKRLKKKAA